jgi:hypothetical protein
MTMTQHYSNPKRASDAHALPNPNIIHVRSFEPYLCPRCEENPGDWVTEHLAHVGWYRQSVSPNRRRIVGPFATEAEALADAREGRGDA